MFSSCSIVYHHRPAVLASLRQAARRDAPLRRVSSRGSITHSRSHSLTTPSTIRQNMHVPVPTHAVPWVRRGSSFAVLHPPSSLRALLHSPSPAKTPAMLAPFPQRTYTRPQGRPGPATARQVVRSQWRGLLPLVKMLSPPAPLHSTVPGLPVCVDRKDAAADWPCCLLPGAALPLRPAPRRHRAAVPPSHRSAGSR